MAAGGRAALPALEETASAAQAALDQANEATRDAAVSVLVAEAETHFAVFDELMPRISRSLLALRGLRAMTSSKFNGFHGGAVSGDIAARLAALGFSAPTSINADSEIDQAANVWLRKARALVKAEETGSP